MAWWGRLGVTYHGASRLPFLHCDVVKPWTRDKKRALLADLQTLCDDLKAAGHPAVFAAGPDYRETRRKFQLLCGGVPVAEKDGYTVLKRVL